MRRRTRGDDLLICLAASTCLAAATTLLSGCSSATAQVEELPRAKRPPLVRKVVLRGATVHGTLGYRHALKRNNRSHDQREQKIERREFIALNGFRVMLRNAQTGTLSKAVRTNSLGRFFFPRQNPGTYQLVWPAQNGWAAGKFPKDILVINRTQRPSPVLVEPEKGTSVLVGQIKLGNGNPAWNFEPFFEIDETAIVSASTGKDDGKRVRANYAGTFAIAGLPVSDMKLNVEFGAEKAVFKVSQTQLVSPAEIPTFLLKNRPPKISGLITMQGGSPVDNPAAGAPITLSLRMSDPDGDPLTVEWKSLRAGLAFEQLDDGSARLAPSDKPTSYTFYAIVRDGRGGSARGRFIVHTGRTTELFSGRVVTTSGRPVRSATVTVNGKSATKTGSNGEFRLRAPLAERYVLSARADKLVPLSRVFSFGVQGQTYQMVPAQVTRVDPRRAIRLTDQRGSITQRDGRSAEVRLPAGSLVDGQGKKPTGMLSATFATLDITRGEAPGDWEGLGDDGRVSGLISYGVAFAEFTDSNGTKYNLGPGQKGEVVIPVQGVVRTAPASIKIWSYDEATGYWSISGDAVIDRVAGVYRGTVKHFSFINMDQPGNTTSFAVFRDVSLPGNLTLRVSDAGPADATAYAQVKSLPMNQSATPVHRVPINRPTRFEILDADGNLVNHLIIGEPGDVRETAVGGTTITKEPGGGFVVTSSGDIVSGNLWPDVPNIPVANYITLKLGHSWSSYPNSPFFTFLGAGSNAQATTYYQQVDPSGLRQHLSAWWSVNGFTATGGDPDLADPNNFARTSFLNNNDLGSGRDMHFLRLANGNIAAYVTNYVDADNDTGPDNLPDGFNQNPDLADEALAQNEPVATVCMEYAPVEGGTQRIVKFFVYAHDPADPTNATLATLSNAAELDGFGAKFVPHLCLNCHGGAYDGVNPDLGSSFRELDTATYKFPGGNALPSVAAQHEFFIQNRIIHESVTAAGDNPIAVPAIKSLIEQWYDADSSGVLEDTEDGLQDNSVTPVGWVGVPQEDLYHGVIKHACRTCHIAFNDPPDPTLATRNVDWNQYSDMINNISQAYITPAYIGDIAAGSLRLMPHALVTYRNFWLTIDPSDPSSLDPFRPKLLWDYSDGSDWPQAAIDSVPTLYPN